MGASANDLITSTTEQAIRAQFHPYISSSTKDMDKETEKNMLVRNNFVQEYDNNHEGHKGEVARCA